MTIYNLHLVALPSDVTTSPILCDCAQIWGAELRGAEAVSEDVQGRGPVQPGTSSRQQEVWSVCNRQMGLYYISTYTHKQTVPAWCTHTHTHTDSPSIMYTHRQTVQAWWAVYSSNDGHIMMMDTYTQRESRLGGQCTLVMMDTLWWCTHTDSPGLLGSVL